MQILLNEFFKPRLLAEFQKVLGRQSGGIDGVLFPVENGRIAAGSVCHVQRADVGDGPRAITSVDTGIEHRAITSPGAGLQLGNPRVKFVYLLCAAVRFSRERRERER